ncbi:MAG TPA: hypothetical protein VGF61_21210 [Candidatus Acidoferrum sp.]|jgi:hypothetical protein
MVTQKLPLGIRTLGFFWGFATLAAFLAALTLLFPHSPLDRIWRLNPTAYQQLAHFGRPIGIPFLLLTAALLATCIGWIRGRLWAWRLALVILAAQLSGDLVNLFRGHIIEGAIGVAVSSFLIVYLLRPASKSAFLL